MGEARGPLPVTREGVQAGGEGAPLWSVQVDKGAVAKRQRQPHKSAQKQYDKNYAAMMTAIIQSRYANCIIYTKAVCTTGPYPLYTSRDAHSGVISSVNNLPNGVINPFAASYNMWLAVTILAAALSGWFEIFMMAFADYPGLYPATDFKCVIEYIMFIIFGLDMLLHFRVAILQGDHLISRPADIAKAYGRGRFIIDLISVIPFDYITLAIMGKQSAHQRDAPGVSALKLLRVVRMYRLRYFFNFLAVHPRVPYTLLVIIRNYTIVFYVAHFAGSMLYYIARLQDFSTLSWVMQNADRFQKVGMFGKYLYSLYWATTTLTSIGYGDLHPYTIPETAFVIIYQATIITIIAFLTASITSLVIKSDTFTGRYHESLRNLLHYSRSHALPQDMEQSLADHLRLHMGSEAASDSTILAIYPSAVRRKVLRHLYLDDFQGCYLFQGCPGPFLDKLITNAHVEMYMPEVEIITCGEGVDHLYILVSGEAELTSTIPADLCITRPSPLPSAARGLARPSAVVAAEAHPDGVLLTDGSMFGELAFFLQDNSLDTVRTLTVCRVLALSRKMFNMIKSLYPPAVRIVLQNLQAAATEAVRKQEEMGIPLSAHSTVWAAVTPGGLQRQNSHCRTSHDEPDYHPPSPKCSRRVWRQQRQQLKQQLASVSDLLQEHDLEVMRRNSVPPSSTPLGHPSTSTSTTTSPPLNDPSNGAAASSSATGTVSCSSSSPADTYRVTADAAGSLLDSNVDRQQGDQSLQLDQQGLGISPGRGSS